MTKSKKIKKNIGISPERLAELRRVTLIASTGNVFTSKTMTYPEHEAMESRLRETYQEVTSENLEALTKELISISGTAETTVQNRRKRDNNTKY